ncbi:MAG: RidA family protein [Pseudomonadota bacterium]
MTNTIEKRLSDLGLSIPVPSAPQANYVPFTEVNGLVHISGQLPMEDAAIKYTGRCGENVDIETGADAARLCAIQLLAQAQRAAGHLGNVRVVKITGFVNSTPDFGDQPKVMNGASDLLVAVMGDHGRHSRSAVGVAALPFGVPVEVEGIFARLD